MVKKNTGEQLSVLTPEEINQLIAAVDTPLREGEKTMTLEEAHKQMSMRGRGLCDGTWD